MAHSTCTPPRIFGPFDQHLFMGVSVSSFSSSVGWNGQQGELTVQLVRDPCPPKVNTVKKYYDESLEVQDWTDPDPGFTYPTIGSPCYFRIEDFEFSGLLQSYDEQESESGHVYVVKLVDPSEILRGTQLILNDYAGSVYGIHNLLNVYGYAESYGSVCPPTQINGAFFGSPAGAFGAANVNANGMPWYMIRDAVHSLCSAFPHVLPGGIFGPYNRLIFKGSAPADVGYGVMPSDAFDSNYITEYPGHNGYLNYYLVDMSQVPTAPDYWRLAGPTMSLMDAISEICEDAGYDFYVELVPLVYGGGVLKVIKVRTARRRSQPTLGQITAFLTDPTAGVQQSEGANQIAVGVELRNEVTSTLLIGGQVESIYQAITPALLDPYWGLDGEGNVIPPLTVTEGSYNIDGFLVDITHLNSLLYNPLPVNAMFVTIDEIRAALMGKDSWISWSSNVNSLVTVAPTFGGYMGDKMAAVVNWEPLRAGVGKAMLAHDTTKLSWPDSIPRDKTEATFRDVATIFNFINVYATQYYGKKFTVRLPYTCVKREDESNSIITTESPTESGWTEFATIIGLPHPTPFTDFFGEENGKIKCFVGYTNADQKTFSQGTDSQEFVVSANILYIKAEVDTSGFVYEDAETFLGPRVIIEVPDRVIQKLPPDEIHRTMKLLDEIGAAIALIGGGGGGVAVDTVIKQVGNAVLNHGLENVAFVPDYAAVPLKSNVQTYGPWYWNGPPGQVRIEHDEGLVPWEYGGETPLQIAGLYKAEEGVTYMQAGEMGNVTIPGLPALNLGAELRSGAPSLVETRAGLSTGTTFGTSVISAVEDAWTGLDGPNITNVNCEIGQSGATTSYQMRTYTPKFGRFAKNIHERIKASGLRDLRIRKSVRLAQFNLFNAVRGSIQRKAYFKSLVEDAKEEGATPVELMFGQIVKVGSQSRTAVVISDPQEAITEYTEEYAQKAIASLDTLFRPISKDGTDELPGYVTPAGATFAAIAGVTRHIEPPIENYTRIEISTDKLDPVMDIDDPKYLTTPTDCHHDMEVLAYGITPPTESHILPVRANMSTEAATYMSNNYRFHAIRGPIMIHGWGYDIDGKPVPNEADGEGTFVTSGLKDRFKVDWLEKPETWPVAPLDVRYDRERGVWTFLNGFRNVRARLLGPINESTDWKAEAEILDEDGRPIENAEGSGVVTKEITIWCPYIDVDGTGYAEDAAKVGTYADRHDILVAYYDTSKDRYYGLQQRRRIWGIATIADNMCPAAVTVGIANFRLLPSGDESVSTGYNDFSLAGMGGDKILLVYDANRRNTSGAIESGWVIVQVQHHEEAKLPLNLEVIGSCLKLKYAKGAVMRCEAPTTIDLICWTLCPPAT
jgi:hypothetical protein